MRALLLLCAAGVALVLSSPVEARPATVPPGVWAGKVCTAVGGWEKTITASANSLTKTMTKAVVSGGLRSARAGLVAFLDTLTADTDALTARIRAAGTPAGKGGPEAVVVIERFIGQARAIFVAARTAAAKLSVTNATAFAAAAGKIGDAMGKASGALDTKHLDASFKALGTAKEPASCVALG